MLIKLSELILIALTFSSAFSDSYVSKPKPTIRDFDKWIEKFEKSYENNKIEYMKRFEIFLNNHQVVESLNQLYFGETEFELNAFADLTAQEFKSKILMKPYNGPFTTDKDKYLQTNVQEKLTDLPDSFDWREKGAVTQVRDQGSVGTCWAFSTVQNIEGQYFLKGNPLTLLSVEQIVDCDGVTDNSTIDSDCGVYGGWPFLAFQYVSNAGGLATEQNYPYCAGTGACSPCEAPGYLKERCGPPIPFCYLKDSCQAKFNTSLFAPNLKVVDWKRVGENETDIANSLMNVGPLSVALNAVLLQFYHKGIFEPKSCNPANLDHAVLLVGWGVETNIFKEEKPFWIVKNSWGPKWGEDGYFRILRNKGMCGINTQVTTAILA